MTFSIRTDIEKGYEVAVARLRGGDSSYCFVISLLSLVNITFMIGQNAVVFPPFSQAVQLKIEAFIRFSLTEPVLCLKQASLSLRLSLPAAGSTTRVFPP